MGTVPHALVAAYGGDTVEAAKVLARQVGADVDVIALVDFQNDSVGTALEVARALGPRLYAVRLDTSDTMVDRALFDIMSNFDPRGVNPTLVRKVREALDSEGFDHVRIICSGGFNATRILEFEAAGVPVDGYGVGSALLEGSYDFTADVVRVEGKDAAKVGRAYRESVRLEEVT